MSVLTGTPSRTVAPANALSACELHPRDLSADHIADWKRFQSSSRFLDSPFYAPEYVYAVGEARPDTRVAVLSHRDRICGFFPYHRLARSIARPVGGVFSDYQGPILDQGIELTAEALLRACALRAYDFNHCPTALTPLSRAGFIQSRSPRIEFPEGYDAYALGCNSTLRDAIRNTDRRTRKISREIGPVTYCMDDRREECWDWLVATKTKSLARQAVKAGFHIPWIKRLHDMLRQTHSTEFSGVLSTVSCADRLIAAHFGLRRNEVLCWWHTTFDEDYRQYAPGLMLLLATIREGARNGLKVIDLGRGNQHYKMVFANGHADLSEGAIAREGSVAAWLRQGHRQVFAMSNRLPLGRWQTLPHRAVGRLVSNVRLPA
jgi:CelD/BcsL family acetyltransferase involved in cellulose biosynthesis